MTKVRRTSKKRRNSRPRKSIKYFQTKRSFEETFGDLTISKRPKKFEFLDKYEIDTIYDEKCGYRQLQKHGLCQIHSIANAFDVCLNIKQVRDIYEKHPELSGCPSSTNCPPDFLLKAEKKYKLFSKKYPHISFDDFIVMERGHTLYFARLAVKYILKNDKMLYPLLRKTRDGFVSETGINFKMEKLIIYAKAGIISLDVKSARHAVSFKRISDTPYSTYCFMNSWDIDVGELRSRLMNYAEMMSILNTCKGVLLQIEQDRKIMPLHSLSENEINMILNENSMMDLISDVQLENDLGEGLKINNREIEFDDLSPKELLYLTQITERTDIH